MENANCCICNSPLDPDGRYDEICRECKVSLQVVRTDSGLIITR